MNEAAALMIGVHDFASFGQPTQGETTLRKVIAANWQADGHLWRFEIEANAFLKRMVRTVVSTLIEIGKGWRPAEYVATLLEKRDRSLAAAPAPPCGLCLVEVRY